MRRRIKHHAAFLLILVSALFLAGCYTMLKHPDVTDQYAFDDGDEDMIVDNCGECHAVDYEIPWTTWYDDGAVAAAAASGSVRPIDPAAPVRTGGIGPGPLLLPPAGGGSTGDGKAAGDASGTGTKSGGTIKKEQAGGGKAPVRREEEKKDAEDEGKKDDKKKE